MRRIVVIAVTGLSMAGCSSFSLDAFKSAPPPVIVQLDSIPPGADASAGGQGCKTPCSLTLPAADFNVTFTLNKFQPLTVPVHVTVTSGDYTSPPTVIAEPNPIVAELQPATPVRKPKLTPKPGKPKKKPKPSAAAPADSPFPPPPGAR
jgi:hypothetical protein